MKRLTLALAFAALIPIANAVEYTQIQTDKSAINFVYKQMGVAVDGKFKKFSSQLSLTRPNRLRPRPASMSNSAASTPAPRKATRKSPASSASRARRRTSSSPPPSRRKATPASSTAASPSAAPTLPSAKAAGPSSTSSPTTCRSSSASPLQANNPQPTTGEPP